MAVDASKKTVTNAGTNRKSLINRTPSNYLFF
ncbi:hypothetical protein SAMN05444412_1444, partial [Rhodonellum ikkaensis]